MYPSSKVLREHEQELILESLNFCMYLRHNGGPTRKTSQAIKESSYLNFGNGLESFI